MSLITKTTKSKVVLKYPKSGSISFNIDELADNQTIFETALLINGLQDIPVSGIYKSTEVELISI